jgi:transcription initiation factor TFIIB
VVAESSIDRGPEWRSFADDTTHGENPERTGAPVTPTRHDDGLTTEISHELNGRTKGPSAAKRRRLGRLRKRHRRTQLRSKRERNQMQGLLEIDRMASALGLPDSIEEQASVLFRSAHDANLLKGRSIEAMATASLYAACRCSETARLFRDVLRVSRDDESSVSNAYGVLNRELGLPTPPPSPASYLPQFASELDLGQGVERRAHAVLKQAEERGIANGRNPAGVAGACLLVAARDIGGRPCPTQEEVAEVADVSPPTLRNRRDELLALREIPTV